MMKHLLSFTFLTVFLILFCAACQSPRYIELGLEDSGRIIECDPDDVIAVRLTSNASTGYSWKMIAPTDYLVILPEPAFYVRQSGQEKMVGSPSAQIFKFKAIDKGEAPVSLIYSRSWEKKAPAKRFDLLVRVRKEGRKSDFFVDDTREDYKNPATMEDLLQ